MSKKKKTRFVFFKRERILIITAHKNKFSVFLILENQENKNKNPIHEIIYFDKEKNGTKMEIAMQYNMSYQENIFTF